MLSGVSEQIDEALLEAEDKMEKAVSVAKDDFGAIRTGRATPSMFNKIVADYYGTLTPVNRHARMTTKIADPTSADPPK